MESESTDTLQLRPVKAYNAPSYPTYSSASANPALLKKLPSRWQANAKVIACISVLGTVALTGCDNQKQPDPNTPAGLVEKTKKYNHTRVRMHHGGAGSTFYVVYLTEQDVFSIIQAEAKAAGLVLDLEEGPFNIDDGWTAYELLTCDAIKIHEYGKGFTFGEEDGREDIGRLLYSKNLRELFYQIRQEGLDQNKGYEGMLWSDFLKLLNEKGEPLNP